MGSTIRTHHSQSLETLDNGKAFASSSAGIDYTVKSLRYFAGWTDKICGKTVPLDGPYFTYTKLEPIGVAAAILPVGRFTDRFSGWIRIDLHFIHFWEIRI